jgi:CheY-like chemotaxis protein
MSEKPGTKPPQSAHESNQPARLGGARADFVASLGRKANDARAVLATAAAERGSANEKGPRDELRRRIHALATSARMLRFDAMTQALAEAELVLDRATEAGQATEDDFMTVANVLDDLPALAWGDGPRQHSERPAQSTQTAQAAQSEPGQSAQTRSEKRSDPPEEATLLRTALLVGSEMLAEALTDEDVLPGALPYECERTDDAQAAIALARRVAPDVVVIDADVSDAAELVEALLDDPLTEPVPIVIVGGFREGAAAARYVALGVAKTLTKPITAEALRRACDEAVEHRNEVTMRVTLGEPTLEQLGERLADEVRAALVESVDAAGRGVRVPLGEGTEVMSAMWGAIARVREVIVARTGGAVRFGSTGPEGAVALAPWLQPDLPGTDRLMASVGRGRGPAADVRLHGRRVIVADDDPGVTWFIADLLRTAGCNVHEALDGTTALDLAYRTSPELVISDILMPGIDGFALTRMLKRDVALRDVPVILLSWKEDLLQRVRELGASAAAYLRKESDSRSILARVRECLRPRARVEGRLRTEGEVRGRLDGLTVRSLLELACAIRPESRVAVRDASFLYEVEIRAGAPKRATRTSSDGIFERGERVLGAMLGVGAGRFTVSSSEAAIPAEDRDLGGSLTAQLARPIALARASRSVITGAKTMGIERLKLDAAMMPSLVGMTPEPARSIVKALAEGRAPRAMLLGGEVDPMLLEDVLGDLAARGAVQGVWTNGGEEVLVKALDLLLAPPEPAVRSAPPPSPSRPSVRSSSRPPPPERMRPSITREPDMTPSSLADAVMRELSDRAPELRNRSSNPPPIVEVSDLRPRSSKPPLTQPLMQGAERALPPDADMPDLTGFEEDGDGSGHVLGHASADPFPSAAGIADSDLSGDQTEIDAPVAPTKDAMGALPEEDPFADFAPFEPAAPLPHEESPSIPIEVGSLVSAPVGLKELPGLTPEPPEPLRTPLSSVASRDPAALERPPLRPRWPWVIAMAVVAGGVLAGTFAVRTQASAPVAAGEGPDLVQSLPLTSGVPVASEANGVSYDALPEALPVAPGQGVLEVNVGASVPLKVDGVARGTGPVVRVPLTAGPHEVVAAIGEHRSRSIEVRAGRTARVDLSIVP